MSHIIADRVQETSTTEGTGTFALAGAEAGFRAFSEVCANSDTAYYCAVLGSHWEVGLGTWSGNTLARTTVLSSSDSGAKISFGEGSKKIWLDKPAVSMVPTGLSNATPMPNGVASPGVMTAASKGDHVHDETLPRTIAALYPPVSIIDQGTVGPQDVLANRTAGVQFSVLATGFSISGIRFYGFASKTYKLTIWDAAGTALATVNVTTTSVSGAFVGTFATPVALTPYVTYTLGVWHTAGTSYPSSATAYQMVVSPFMMTPYILMRSTVRYKAADGFPDSNSSTIFYMVEPVLMATGSAQSGCYQTSPAMVAQNGTIPINCTSILGVWEMQGGTDLVPTMTTNTAPTGIALGQSEYGAGYEAFRCFDKDGATYWRPGSSYPTHYVQYKFDAAQIVTGITMDQAATYRMTAWNFSGSNNGTDYTLLDARSGVDTWVQGTPLAFGFTNSTPYLFYRLQPVTVVNNIRLFALTMSGVNPYRQLLPVTDYRIDRNLTGGKQVQTVTRLKAGSSYLVVDYL